MRRVHFGCGARNPLDGIRFFDTRLDTEQPVRVATRQPSTMYAARLPAAFEERSVRVWVTEDTALPAAQEAFEAWCEARELCNEACQIEQVAMQDELDS